MPTNMIITNFTEITNIVELINTNFVTNVITEIHVKEMSSVPTDWWVLGVAIFGACATALSAWFMWKSVNEMKLQRALEIQKIEQSDLKDFINTNIAYILNESEKSRGIKPNKPRTHAEINLLNDKLFSALLTLSTQSYNMYYEKDFNKIWQNVNQFKNFILYSNEYSQDVATWVGVTLMKVSKDLYRALNDKDQLTELMKVMLEYKILLNSKLTENERQKFEEHTKQQEQTASNYMTLINTFIKEQNK